MDINNIIIKKAFYRATKGSFTPFVDELTHVFLSLVGRRMRGCGDKLKQLAG